MGTGKMDNRVRAVQMLSKFLRISDITDDVAQTVSLFIGGDALDVHGTDVVPDPVKMVDQVPSDKSPGPRYDNLHDKVVEGF
jgi:hypothetical protein